MKKIQLEIIALSHSIQQAHSYAIVLGEMGGVRRLPIVIGGFEAQAIAVAIEKMTPSRPLTHDLLKNIFQTFHIELKEVIINNLQDGIFYAQLICQHGKDIIEIDSRTSDALAIAVRFECPIYTYEFILESAGVIMEEGKEPKLKEEGKEKFSSKPKTKTPADISKLSIDELNKLLEETLKKEEYERAIQIRDEINKRKSGS